MFTAAIKLLTYVVQHGEATVVEMKINSEAGFVSFSACVSFCLGLSVCLSVCLFLFFLLFFFLSFFYVFYAVLKLLKYVFLTTLLLFFTVTLGLFGAILFGISLITMFANIGLEIYLKYKGCCGIYSSICGDQKTFKRMRADLEKKSQIVDKKYAYGRLALLLAQTEI